MKKLFLLIWVAAGFSMYAQEIPDRRETLKNIVLANDFFMKKYADYSMPTYVGRLRPSNIWTRAVYYEGLMALYTIYPRQEYYDYAYNWGEFHKWGFWGGNTTRNADNQCASQTYIDLYNLSQNPELIKNVRINTNMLLNTPQNNDWTWIDAIQMAMPILAKMGKLTGDTRYYDKMWEMYVHTRNIEGDKGLFNPKDGLWWRDKDFDPPYKEPNGEDCYWSRGNGWVYAALVRILTEIPANEQHRTDYTADFQAMTKAIINCQREDGFWNPSLHDPNNFGSKETTGTSLFVYGLAWGINNGILNAKTCLPVVIKAWNALCKESLHENGFLGFIQGTGKEPKDGQPVTYDKVPDFEDYGLGCFLLAGTEVYKLK
ncbi:MAG: glycoside hydrolase family 88 protein [Tannerella sp.]|nr:glycoside hydrolase family 88 protein [Tannerella sp.]